MTTELEGRKNGCAQFKPSEEEEEVGICWKFCDVSWV